MKNIVWNHEEINRLRKGHVYNDMSDEIKVSAKKLADTNVISEGMARVIVVMLMSCGAYKAIRMTNTRVEFIIGSGNADVLYEGYAVTAYACGIKAFRMGIENYLNDLFGYLR